MPLRNDLTPDDIVRLICDHATALLAAREMGLAPDTEENRMAGVVVTNTFCFLLRALGFEWGEIREMLRGRGDVSVEGVHEVQGREAD